jgi:hypothetical protein
MQTPFVSGAQQRFENALFVIMTPLQKGFFIAETAEYAEHY